MGNAGLAQRSIVCFALSSNLSDEFGRGKNSTEPSIVYCLEQSHTV